MSGEEDPSEASCMIVSAVNSNKKPQTADLTETVSTLL